MNQLSGSQSSSDQGSRLDFRVPDQAIRTQTKAIELKQHRPQVIETVTQVPQSKPRVEPKMDDVPPERSSDSIQEKSREHVHLLQAGESLHQIARTKLGNASYWVQIYRKNHRQLKSVGPASAQPIELALPQDPSANDMIECAMHNRQLLLKRR
ncbi:MAG: hypothetical protein ACKVH8_15570 [Pirellulales bacterium]